MSTRTLKILDVSLAAGLLAAGGCAGRRATVGIPVAAPPAAEIRALWVDEYHAGIRSPQEADQLVADAKRANINTLFVQVRGRGDALYTQSFEPPREDPAYDPQFDALAYILDAGHRAGLEVHAWINAMPVWRDPEPPRDPRHVLNQHGPGKTGADDWLTHSPEGESRFPVGYFLDPGHPGVAAYLTEVYLNIVRHYAVDGIHFDYIRYPETEASLPRGAPVGYNATSLERFRRTTGRKDTPAPDDPQWTAWRRQQVTQLVRRISIEAKALNPRLKVSAAVIAWGEPPGAGKSFEQTAPMQRIFQDWQGWLREGLLDLAAPMNYAREADPAARQRFDGWIRWEKRHKHGRELVIGLGAYLNAPVSTLAQIKRARKPEGKNRAEGISLFSYAALAPPVPAVTPADAAPPSETPDRFAFLTAGTPPEPPAFSGPTPVPAMDWIERPTSGWLTGMVRGTSGIQLDGAQVELKRGGWFGERRRTVTDGNGRFGFAELKPGRYRVRLKDAGKRNPANEVEVVAGRVARVELTSQ